jgi:hypothetical protein
MLLCEKGVRDLLQSKIVCTQQKSLDQQSCLAEGLTFYFR